MISKTAIIKNKMGIHVRPSGLIIAETQHYSGSILLNSKGLEMELNSIMDLLALGLEMGNELKITVTGEDEESCCTKLVEIFEGTYDFPEK